MACGHNVGYGHQGHRGGSINSPGQGLVSDMGYNISIKSGNVQNTQMNQINQNRDIGVKSEPQGQHMIPGVDYLMLGGPDNLEPAINRPGPPHNHRHGYGQQDFVLNERDRNWSTGHDHGGQRNGSSRQEMDKEAQIGLSGLIRPTKTVEKYSKTQNPIQLNFISVQSTTTLPNSNRVPT